jgi:molybdopterin/thiamine biosynthesis adenylyltransferase
MQRHSRHELFPPIGPQGQKRLYAARVAVVGCGAVGSHSVEMLARAGVGRDGLIRVIDRDYVDTTNLQRQAMFTELDATESRPKAAAAAAHIQSVDQRIRIEPVVRDFSPSNARRLIADVDLVVDGTDNFRSRFILNDAALAENKPWVYGGAIASRGAVAFLIPGATPCLRCYLESAPTLGSYDSCDTAGIITPAPPAVAAFQVTLVMRWIVGERDLTRGILTFDLWKETGRITTLLARARPNPSCPSCGTWQLPALSQNEEFAILCGRNSVQLFTRADTDLSQAATQMQRAGRNLRRHRESITAEIDEGLLTLFEDGRVIVEGTTDPLQAKTIVTRYLGG